MSSEQLSLEEEIENLSHEDLLEITRSTLRRLLTSDPLLKDLPSDVTVEEVSSQIAIIQGQSITVNVLRNLETLLAVVVAYLPKYISAEEIQLVIPQQGTTVRDLKKAIQRTFNLRQQRLRSMTKISWKYVWKTYNLQHSSEVMRDDDEVVSNYGVHNKSEIIFTKKLRKKSRQDRRP